MVFPLASDFLENPEGKNKILPGIWPEILPLFYPERIQKSGPITSNLKKFNKSFRVLGYEP
jgi:hypothetical protein